MVLNFNYLNLSFIKIKVSNYFRIVRALIKKILGISFKLFIIDLIIVILLGMYISKLLFGSSSLEVLNSLKKERILLKKEIEDIKIVIMKLHKEYLKKQFENSNNSNL